MVTGAELAGIALAVAAGSSLSGGLIRTSTAHHETIRSRPVVARRSGTSRVATGRPAARWRRSSPARGARNGRRAGARWADVADLAHLVTAGGLPGRLTLGYTSRGRWGRRIATEPAHSLAVIGPTQSGKTTCLAVPAILEWKGPVLAASVKTDLVRDTLQWRSGRGRVWCFDPTGATGLTRSHWSPLASAATWPGARRAAADLTELTRTDGASADAEFWYATAAKLLAPLLFAAAVAGATMHDVIRWVETQETDEVAAILYGSGVPEALQAARATWLRDERQRSSVYTTAETVLEPFAEPFAGASPSEDIDPAALLAGHHTLYVCAPAHDQRRLRTVFVALVQAVVHAAFARVGRLGAPLDPPLLVVLDEAANIAPLRDLDGLAATCAGHGVQLVTVWQDLAQVRARYGDRAATVVNNHRAKLFLPGIADPATLDFACQLAGDAEVDAPSVTVGASGERSVTSSPSVRRLLPGDALRRLPRHEAVLLYGSLPPARLCLRPWYEDRALVRRNASGAAVPA